MEKVLTYEEFIALANEFKGHGGSPYIYFTRGLYEELISLLPCLLTKEVAIGYFNESHYAFMTLFT